MNAITTKPIARGYVHQVSIFIALCACIFLITKSDTTNALIANLIYSFSLVTMYTASALYHTPMWSRSKYLLMRSIDHAAIFALIAGTATPICLIAMKGTYGTNLLILFWTAAFIGMFSTIFWTQSPKWVRASLYVIVGWLAIPFMGDIKTALGVENLELLLLGGVVYTVGALIYAMKRPNPFPRVFGYHEIFHIFVVFASAFHFMVIYHITTNMIS